MPNKILCGLDKVPRLPHLFLWADYVELLCLTNLDGIFSPSHLNEAMSETDDLGIDVEDPENGDVLPCDDNDLKLLQRWSDIYTKLQQRKACYGNAWPFILEDGIIKSNINLSLNLHRLYIALLVASSLRYCPESRRIDVTKSLEEIGYYLFKTIMPNGWQVYPFGAHQNLDPHYSGHLYDKLSLLAKDIRGCLTVKKDDFDPRDTGDGGIDVVAWHDLGDSREGIPIAFGQCGCSPEEWPLKSLECHPAKLRASLSVMHEWATYYIMPHDMRSSSGDWEKRSDFGTAIYVDRYRIIKLAEKFDIPFPKWDFVSEAVSLSLTTY